MKTIEELNASKVPIIIIDKALDKLVYEALFPDKVEKAKETIDKIGTPSKEAQQLTKKRLVNLFAHPYVLRVKLKVSRL